MSFERLIEWLLVLLLLNIISNVGMWYVDKQIYFKYLEQQIIIAPPVPENTIDLFPVKPEHSAHMRTDV